MGRDILLSVLTDLDGVLEEVATEELIEELLSRDDGVEKTLFEIDDEAIVSYCLENGLSKGEV